VTPCEPTSRAPDGYPTLHSLMHAQGKATDRVWCADSKVGGGGKSLVLFCLILAGKCTSAHCEPTPRAAHQHPTLHTYMRVQMRATTRVWCADSKIGGGGKSLVLFCLSLAGKCTSAHCGPTPRAAHQHPTLHTYMRVQMRATTRLWCADSKVGGGGKSLGGCPHPS